MFNSILFPDETAEEVSLNQNEPDCFKDLNLDQVLNKIFNLNKEYSLNSYFYTPLKDYQTINYRQEFFKDLDLPQNKEPFE